MLLDALRADRRVYRGQSQAIGPELRLNVNIVDHPNDRLNGEYLIQQTFHTIAEERYRTGERSGRALQRHDRSGAGQGRMASPEDDAAADRPRPRDCDHHRPGG